MTVKYGNRVLQTTTTSGTGTYTLGSAPTGWRSFLSAPGIYSGDRVGYVVVDSMDVPTQWEINEGVITSGSSVTLSRALVHESSNGGAPVNWGDNTTKYVFAAIPAQRALWRDEGGALSLAGAFSCGDAVLGGDSMRVNATPGVIRRLEVTGSASAAVDATLSSNSGGVTFKPADGTVTVSNGVYATVLRVQSPGRADLMLEHTAALPNQRRLMLRGKDGSWTVGWEDDAVTAFWPQFRVACATASNRAVTMTGSFGGAPALGADGGVLSLTAIPALPAYTVGTLPVVVEGGLIHVSNGSGNRSLATGRSGAWRWADGTVVS